MATPRPQRPHRCCCVARRWPGAPWGASLRSPAGFPGAVLGVCRGSVSGFVSVSGGFPWFAGCASGRALVASAGRVCPGRWRLSLASPGVLAGILRRGGRGRLQVVRRCVGVRSGVVGLGGFPAGRSPLCRCNGSGLGCLRAGGLLALVAAGVAGGAARSHLGFWRLGLRFLSPPWRAARRPCHRWPGWYVNHSASSPTGNSNRGRSAALGGTKSIISGSSFGVSGSVSGHSFACQH